MLYVGLENIERGGGLVGVRPTTRGQLASTKFRFDERHVLFGKLRPNLAKIVRPRFAGVCSTDILPVRPGPLLDRDYLAHFLALPDVVGLATSRATGVNLPRLSPSELQKFEIPLPPIGEQRRIADILDRADALRARRREALVHLDDLTQSIFLDMFGEVLRNPLELRSSTVGEVATLVTDGEHQTPRRQGSGIRLLSARNIRDGYLDLTDVDYIGEQEFDRLRRRIEPQAGDILISCSGSIGRVAQVREEPPFAMVRSVALVRSNRAAVNPTFLEHQLRQPAVRALMHRRANASSQANLFQKDIRPLPVLVPSMADQDEFDRRVSRQHMFNAAKQLLRPRWKPCSYRFNSGRLPHSFEMICSNRLEGAR